MPQRIWRSHCPIEVREVQRRVLDATVHLLMVRQNGPTAFTLLDECKKATYQVCLGDPHKCSCKYFQRINELCEHICWVLLKKMRIDPKDPISFQLGMLTREITDCLQPQLFIPRPRHKKVNVSRFLKLEDDSSLPSVSRRAIQSGDSCPVCLEPFEPACKDQITYCRHGCGNCVHVRCMQLIAKHQMDDSYNHCAQITCPLCRGDFGTISEMRSEKWRTRVRRATTVKEVQRHSGHNCCSCDESPVLGNLYRCLLCTQVTFCSKCVHSMNSTAIYHELHGFAVKFNENDRWKPLHYLLEKNDVRLKKQRGELPSPLIEGKKRANNAADGVRTFPPPALCVSVAFPGQHDCKPLPIGRLSRTSKAQSQTEGGGALGGGRLVGLLVDDAPSSAPRGARLPHQPRAPASTAPAPPSSRLHPSHSNLRSEPYSDLHSSQPSQPQVVAPSKTQTTQKQRQRRRFQQIASRGEQGSSFGSTSPASNGRFDVSETVKRMFPPRYLERGSGGEHIGRGEWRIRAEEEEASAERDITGAARLLAAPAPSHHHPSSPLQNDSILPATRSLLPHSLPRPFQESGARLLQDESVLSDDVASQRHLNSRNSNYSSKPRKYSTLSGNAKAGCKLATF